MRVILIVLAVVIGSTLFLFLVVWFSLEIIYEDEDDEESHKNRERVEQ